MRKFTITVVTLLLIMTNSYAQFSTESDIRVRSEIGTVDLYGVSNRRVDIRFRPTFFYKLNDNLSFASTLEVGDIGFGDSYEGGSQGTDQRVLELKHLYMKITPPLYGIFGEHNVKLGLQRYKDFQGLIFDDDVAGVLYEGKIKDFGFGAGWFVPYDLGEEDYDTDTYSAGETIFSLDLNYKMKIKELELTGGMQNFLSLSNYYDEADIDHVKEINETGYWMAPYAKGKFRDLNFETEFVYYMNKMKETAVLHEMQGLEEWGIKGIAFSLKTDYQIIDKLNTKLNILIESGVEEGGMGGYIAHTASYDTGLEILNHSNYTNGIYSYDPMHMDAHSYNGDYGIFVPALIINYVLIDKKIDIIDKMSLAGFFGMGISMEPVQEPVQNNPEESRMFGVEYGIRSILTVMEHLEVIPYFAMFHAGDAKLYSELDENTNIQRNQYKTGMTLKMMFK